MFIYNHPLIIDNKNTLYHIFLLLLARENYPYKPKQKRDAVLSVTKIKNKKLECAKILLFLLTVQNNENRVVKINDYLSATKRDIKNLKDIINQDMVTKLSDLSLLRLLATSEKNHVDIEMINQEISNRLDAGDVVIDQFLYDQSGNEGGFALYESVEVGNHLSSENIDKISQVANSTVSEEIRQLSNIYRENCDLSLYLGLKCPIHDKT